MNRFDLSPPPPGDRPPRMLAAVEFEDTGSTRIGEDVFDHPLLIPGVTTMTMAVIQGFNFASMVI